MVHVSDIQAQTISTQAAIYLRSNNPIQIPGHQLTQEFAAALNKEIEAQIEPLLEQVRATLRLRVETETVGGTRVVVIHPHAGKRNRRRAAGVFAHGGGFALLNANDYNAYRMAHDLGIVVYSVDYSLSPQVKFPTALDETFAAYRAVSENYRKVVVAGSSAGGNLLITTILKACQGEADPPEAVGLFSPAADLRAIGDSYVANDGRDALLTRDAAVKFTTAYRGSAHATNPHVSPLLADYADGFVPAIITTGTRDLLQSDSVRLSWRLREAGANVKLRVWEGMWHAFESVPGLPEGEQSMQEVFGFLDEYLETVRMRVRDKRFDPLDGVIFPHMLSTPTGNSNR